MRARHRRIPRFATYTRPRDPRATRGAIVTSVRDRKPTRDPAFVASVRDPHALASRRATPIVASVRDPHATASRRATPRSSLRFETHTCSQGDARPRSSLRFEAHTRSQGVSHPRRAPRDRHFGSRPTRARNACLTCSAPRRVQICALAPRQRHHAEVPAIVTSPAAAHPPHLPPVLLDVPEIRRRCDAPRGPRETPPTASYGRGSAVLRCHHDEQFIASPGTSRPRPCLYRRNTLH
jgi:hypothetical protein